MNEELMRKTEERGGPQQPLLIASHLVKTFALRRSLGDFLMKRQSVVHAVSDVSFDVKKHETLGVVGESGCGKSTTARLLMQLIHQTSGEIIFDGDALNGHDLTLRDYRRQVQMVFQDSYSSLNPRLTCLESVAFGPQVWGTPKEKAQVHAAELLDKVGLAPERFANRYPHELSGGQRQRVNIARALASNPRLVILDEAVSALDKSVEAQVLNLLTDLKDEYGLTYIFISHDLNVVRWVSDRVMVMYLGQVVEIGDAQTLFSHPRHPYTRALLSSMPSMDPAKRTERPPLAGDPPDPIHTPTGCRFHTRCAFCESMCVERVPRMSTMADGTQVACHMYSPPEAPHRLYGADEARIELFLKRHAHEAVE